MKLNVYLLSFFTTIIKSLMASQEAIERKGFFPCSSQLSHFPQPLFLIWATCSPATTWKAAITERVEWEEVFMARHFQENSIHLMKNSAGKKGWKCNLAKEWQAHSWRPCFKFLPRQKLLTSTSTNTCLRDLCWAHSQSLFLKKC